MSTSLLKCFFSYTKQHRKVILYSAVSVGVLARFLVAFRGNNFDVNSYWLVGELFSNGENIYAATSRYNYGPIWFHIIGWLFDTTNVFSNHFLLFRLSVTALLTLVDLMIAWTLKKHWGNKVAILFFLNPISIIISGYHSQFDNLAILLGLWAVLILGEKQYQQTDKHQIAGLLMLGGALMTKHIFFLFPIWLAIKQKCWKSRILTLLIPFSLFFMSFVPYWSTGSSGIINNVFLYKSFNNGPFWYSLAPKIITDNVPLIVLFVGTLLCLSFVFRKKSNQETFILYLVSLVVFSSAIANQYLAIAVPFLAIYRSHLSTIFTVVATAYLLTEKNGLHFGFMQKIVPLKFISYNIQIVFLFAAFVFSMKKTVITNWLVTSRKWIKQEFNNLLLASTY